MSMVLTGAEAGGEAVQGSEGGFARGEGEERGFEGGGWDMGKGGGRAVLAEQARLGWVEGSAGVGWEWVGSGGAGVEGERCDCD